MQAENDEFVLSLVAENLGVSIITDRATRYDVAFIPIADFEIEQYISHQHCTTYSDVLRYGS